MVHTFYGRGIFRATVVLNPKASLRGPSSFRWVHELGKWFCVVSDTLGCCSGRCFGGGVCTLLDVVECFALSCYTWALEALKSSPGCGRHAWASLVWCREVDIARVGLVRVGFGYHLAVNSEVSLTVFTVAANK